MTAPMKRLAPWLGWITALLLCVGNFWPRPAEDIEAKSLTIRDANGNRRITLNIAEDGQAMLMVRSKAGMARVALSALEEGKLQFMDSDAYPTSGLWGYPNGHSFYAYSPQEVDQRWLFDFALGQRFDANDSQLTSTRP
jgi:hypothetical protein